MEKSNRLFIAKPNTKMPCFVHNRCASSIGCPKTVPIIQSSVGFSRHDCSKCEFDKGSCLDCHNLNNSEECSFPYRCKECNNYMPIGNYGVCGFIGERVNPNFFCAGWEIQDEIIEKGEETP